MESVLHPGLTQECRAFTIRSVAGCCGGRRDMANWALARVTGLSHIRLLGCASFAGDGKYNCIMCLEGRELEYLSRALLNTIPPSSSIPT